MLDQFRIATDPVGDSVGLSAIFAVLPLLTQSGQTSTLGEFLSAVGGVFVFRSPILGWIGVAVTGSDTSSNALFGAPQVQTAARVVLSWMIPDTAR